MIEKCCENCAHYYILDYLDNQKYCEFQDCEIKKHMCSDCFQPKEELVRQDERDKIITDLEYEIQNFNEVRDSKTIDFIYSFIKELKEK